MFDFLIGNDLISSLIAFGLVLIPAVIIHEFGHFLAAKMVGITILEFGVGYPPRLFRLGRWRETEFTFNLIPLGGFVRPLGEDMIRTLNEEQTEIEREALRMRMQVEAEALPEPIDERRVLREQGYTNLKTVNETGPWARIFFMAAGAIFNIVAALLLFIIIGLIGVQQPVGDAFIVTDVRPELALAQAGLMRGDVIETIDGAYISDAADFTALINAAPDGATLTLGVRRYAENAPAETFTVPLAVDTVSGELVFTSSLLVNNIQTDSPAFDAGLMPGDAIVGLDGQSLALAADPFATLQGINVENAGREVMIEVIRDGEHMKLPITPRANPAPGQGYLGAGVETQADTTALGGSFAIYGLSDTVSLPVGEAVSYGVTQLQNVLTAIVSLPQRLLSGAATPEESRVVSIVGISQIGGILLQNSAETGNPFDILNFIALVNIALGLTNLLPLPPLDGGRILFVLIEMARGKPMSQRREEAIMIAGMMFLLALGVVVILQDIASPIADLIAR